MRLRHCLVPFLAATTVATAMAADRVGTLSFSLPLTAGDIATPPGYRVPENVGDIAVDTAGNVYATFLRRVHYALAGGTVQADLFVIKLSPDGDLLYSTLVGNLGRRCWPAKIAVDAQGSAYVTGLVESASFPTTAGAFQQQAPPGLNAFVCKLDPAGQSMLFATYLGGSGDDTPFDIAIDRTGAVYITGDTDSRDFPTTPGTFQPQAPNPDQPFHTDGFVAKLSPDGSELVFSTYLGGSSSEHAYAVDVDDTGAVYVAGSTGSPNFPTTPGAFRTEPASATYAAKLSADGSTLVYSTLIGAGSVSSIAADAEGNLWLGGTAYGDSSGPRDYPTTPDAAGSWGGGRTDAVVSKLDPTGSRLLYSSFFGGFTSEGVGALTLDTVGNVYVTGSTSSSNFPYTRDAEQACLHGARVRNDVYYLMLDSDGRLRHASFLGGLYRDIGTGIAIGPDGGIYLAGITQSPDFPATEDFFEFDDRHGERGFVTKVEFTDRAPSVSCAVNAASQLHEAVAPGEILTFYGRGLESAEVLFDGVTAPRLYSDDRQINLVAPFGIRGKRRVTVEVITPDGRSRPQPFLVRETVPALFTIDGSGNGHVAAINQDGTVNSPANPAPRGSIVTLYATGLGPLTPQPADGEIIDAAPFPLAETPFQVGFHKYPIHGEVTYAGAAPGFIAGAFQINVRIPDAAPPGPDTFIWLEFPDHTFSLAVLIAIE